MSLRIAVVASTAGSVLARLLDVASFKASVVEVVADRPCGAIREADRRGVATAVLATTDGLQFSDALLSHLEPKQVDHLILFYTRRLGGPLLRHYRDRIWNLHPSLLPAFKGLRPFEEAMASGVRVAGTTIHLIGEALDEGRIAVQTVCPVDPQKPPAQIRHRLFEQQCRSLLQLLAWLRSGRIQVTPGRLEVQGARYDDLEYVPALEDAEARGLQVPYLV